MDPITGKQSLVFYFPLVNKWLEGTNNLHVKPHFTLNFFNYELISFPFSFTSLSLALEGLGKIEETPITASL